LCGVRHAATGLIPSTEADKIVAWATKAEAVKNLTLAVEQNYGKNAPLVADMFRIQICRRHVLWPRRDHAAD
jgi:hypothetical protein